MSQVIDQRLLEAIGDIWVNSRIVANVTAFCDECGNRFAGSASELAGRDVLLEQFRRAGLENVHLEPCRYTGWRRGGCTLEILQPRQRALEAVSMVHAPATPEGGLERELLSAGRGTREDFARLGDEVAGKIVLIALGSPLGSFIHRVSRYGWAREHGAAGVIFAKEESGQLLGTGTVAAAYREVGALPALGISYETGQYLLRQLRHGPVRVRLELRNEFVPDAETWNVVGDLPGVDGAEEHLLVGAHWDGHDRADAALDNALGLFTALDAARGLARLKGRLRRGIRFVGFGNEESWIVGSTNYVAQHAGELERLALMVNCDALARFGHTSLRVTKRPEILGYFRRLVAELDLPVPVDSTGWLPGSSDEWPFLVEGVPAVSARGTQTPEERSRGRGLDHTQADTVDKIDDWRAREAAVALARILVAVADDEERPGPKLARAAVFEQLRRDGAEEELRVQGRWHPESIL